MKDLLNLVDEILASVTAEPIRQGAGEGRRYDPWKAPALPKVKVPPNPNKVAMWWLGLREDGKWVMKKTRRPLYEPWLRIVGPFIDRNEARTLALKLKRVWAPADMGGGDEEAFQKTLNGSKS